MKLLDTTFLIHYWGGKEPTATYLEANDEAEFVTTALNIKELAVGRALQGALDEYELLTTFDWVGIVPFDRTHAVLAGELEAGLHRDPTVNQDRSTALAADLLIAAVAKANDATIVTENIDAFDRFDGVSVEPYLG